MPGPPAASASPASPAAGPRTDQHQGLPCGAGPPRETGDGGGAGGRGGDRERRPGTGSASTASLRPARRHGKGGSGDRHKDRQRRPGGSSESGSRPPPGPRPGRPPRARGGGRARQVAAAQVQVVEVAVVEPAQLAQRAAVADLLDEPGAQPAPGRLAAAAGVRAGRRRDEGGGVDEFHVHDLVQSFPCLALGGGGLITDGPRNWRRSIFFCIAAFYFHLGKSDYSEIIAGLRSRSCPC